MYERFTDRARKAMQLGLLREQEGVAAQVLMNLGMRVEDAREAIVGKLSSKESKAMNEPRRFRVVCANENKLYCLFPNGKVTKQDGNVWPSLEDFKNDLSPFAKIEWFPEGPPPERPPEPLSDAEARHIAEVALVAIAQMTSDNPGKMLNIARGAVQQINENRRG